MSKVAYVFPGQGSQAVGMLKDVADAFPVVTDYFARASEALGYDLWDLVQNGPEEQLNQTEYTQPALLTASVALWRVARDKGARLPDVVAGHSLGEYSALVAADAIDFIDAVSLVQKRGRFMQTAVPLGEGGMAAILGLDDEHVRNLCSAASSEGEIVQAANFNAPGQVVIAGQTAALNRAIEACKDAGAKRAMPLAVSAPFHSELMKPAAENMAKELAGVKISKPAIRILQNVDASFHDDPDRVRENLVKQMYSAVLWTDTIKTMCDEGVSVVVECGPGKVLSGLNRRIEKSLESLSMNSPESIQASIEELSRES